MVLKDTVARLHDLLHHVAKDLEKAVRGNKAASQRVRTGTIKLEKVAKAYRKESVSFEKGNRGKKKVPIKVKTMTHHHHHGSASKGTHHHKKKKHHHKKATHHKKHHRKVKHKRKRGR